MPFNSRKIDESEISRTSHCTPLSTIRAKSVTDRVENDLELPQNYLTARITGGRREEVKRRYCVNDPICDFTTRKVRVEMEKKKLFECTKIDFKTSNYSTSSRSIEENSCRQKLILSLATSGREKDVVIPSCLLVTIIDNNRTNRNPSICDSETNEICRS